MSLEVATLDMEYEPGRVTKWIDENYIKVGTKKSYYGALKTWVNFIYGESVRADWRFNFRDEEKVTILKNNRISEIEDGIETYFNGLDDRDFLSDYKKFTQWMRNQGYAPLTIRGTCNKVKLFFGRQDPRCKIDDDEWAQIKRNLLPKSTRASTQDDILTKEQLKMLIQHMPIHIKAIALFLLSTGARIGAVCQLKMVDINLYSDPPEVNIRNEYTKMEVGGRVMWFSYEARDAIIEWHKARKFLKKRGGFGSYDEKMVFNTTVKSFSTHWNRILVKADGGQIPPVLAKRDPSTKQRYHVYHVHTLRKFFRTNMGVEGSYKDRSGVPDMIVHAWMGHKAYLVEYDKLGPKRMAEIYAENMNVVTVYEVGFDEKTRAKYEKTLEMAEKAADQNIEDRVFVDLIGRQLDIPEGLSLDDKKDMIIRNIVEIKRDLVLARDQSIEKLEKALEQVSTTKNAGMRVKAT